MSTSLLAHNFSVENFDERTVTLYDQVGLCEKEYHVGCLRDSGLCDLKECFDPIVASSGRDLIPVVNFGGMYCVILIVKSVVSVGLLRIFGRKVTELPLVATSGENQGKGYFQALFSCIESLLYSLNVENLVLPVAEEAESIWTKKLGFRKMSDERECILCYTWYLCQP
ncbi:hypothetical protein CsSME_00047513 [Camellia sinensis var. sinensis]